MAKKVGSHFTIKTIFTLQKNACWVVRGFFSAVLKDTNRMVFTANGFEKYSEVQALNYSARFSKEIGIQQ